mmetsp:Transcript_11398/g.21623  ORF Transcript_11398/g.21623 Transcript_11398/m.21623 type:complete len:277 (+) Transcript_11398:52-882(+)
MPIEVPTFNAVQMLHAGVVAAVVSLGDQSFYMTLIFGTWCPFQGVRDAWGATCQRLLVWLGVVVAFAGRASLVYHAVEMEFLDMVSGFCASAILILMAIKASYDLGSKSMQQRDAEDEESGKNKKKGEPTPLQPAEDRMMKRYSFAAFVVSAATGFVVFPGGQVDRFVLKGDKPELDLILGSIAGYAVAALVAVIIGSILERTVPVKRLLFANTMGLACLCLWVGSSTFMYYHKTYLAPKWRAAESKAAKQVASLMQSSLGSGRRLARQAYSLRPE